MKGLPDRLYAFLARSDPPRPADAIFVFAGRPERKPYAVSLWRQGLAPTLIVSVGRFEWRGYPDLGIPGGDDLRRQVEATYYKRRHFFVAIGPTGATVTLVEPARMGTWREARGLAREIRTRQLRSLLVVSTSIHLRRVRRALERALRGFPVAVSYVAVPEERSGVRRLDWTRSGAGRAAVAVEALKWLAYRILLR